MDENIKNTGETAPDKKEEIIKDFDSQKLKDFFTYADDKYAADGFAEKFGDEAEETVKKGEKRARKINMPAFDTTFKMLGSKLSAAWEQHLQRRTEEEADTYISLPKSLEKEERRYARPVPGQYSRTNISFIICVIMALMSMTFEIRGHAFIVGENGLTLTALLMVALLAVMFLCFDVTIVGFYSAIKGKFSGEALIALSCVVSLIDGAVILLSHGYKSGMSLCAVSALSVVFGARGAAYYNLGMRDTLKVLTREKDKFGIHADTETVEDRSVLKEYSNAVDGFYANLLRRDICEHLYSYAAPIMALTAIVFAFLSTVVRGRPGDFFHAFAAMTAVSASFSCLSAYSMPFKNVAQIARKTGSAVAGWEGADKLADADGVFISDNDIFPAGTQYVTGVEVNEQVGRQKAIEYAGSLAAASGCGLENPFNELMKSEGVNPSGVEDFSCYEGGGIGGVVRSENVLMGTSAFMDLMGVIIPEEYAKYNGIFLAVNRRFAALFGVSYYPKPLIQHCMVSMRKAGLRLIFAIKDFNISPTRLSKRFKLSLKGMEFIPFSDSYRLPHDEKPLVSDAVAIVGKEGFPAFARIISRSAKLRQAALLGTLVSLLGSACGMILLFRMCWTGPVYSVTSWGVGLYMLAMHLVTVVLAEMVKRS